MLSLLKRYREFLIVSALLLYPFATFLATGHRGREPNFVDRAVISLSSRLQGMMSWAVDGVIETGGNYVALRNVRSRNEALALENSQLRAEVNSLKEAAAENVRLKRALGYAEATPELEIAARIIGVNPIPNFVSVRINRGEDYGVRPGMPVVTPEGVVGQVQRSVGGSSDVVLVTDQTSKLGVLVQRSRVRGTASGGGGHAPLSLDNVLRTEDVESGDVIVTSGTDGIFPKGLVVGRVSVVQRQTSGMFLSASILPAVEMAQLEELLVLPSLAAPTPQAQSPKGGGGAR